MINFNCFLHNFIDFRPQIKRLSKFYTQLFWFNSDFSLFQCSLTSGWIKNVTQNFPVFRRNRGVKFMKMLVEHGRVGVEKNFHVEKAKEFNSWLRFCSKEKMWTRAQMTKLCMNVLVIVVLWIDIENFFVSSATSSFENKNENLKGNC